MEGRMKVSIHPNHGCKSKNMTQNQLMNHLKNKGDSTHKAILVYLTKLASFEQGPARQIQPRIHFPNLLLILTNWQLPGQQ
jgi:hypothetical protein